MDISNLFSSHPLFTRLLVLVSVQAGLAGCAVNPATGNPNLVLMSEEKEIQIGHQMHQQTLQQYRKLDDPALQEYVNTIGQRVAAAGERPHLQYTFTVLDDDLVNAFALLGGHVYITRGLMAYLSSEAELAAVLGHEVGHITARHAVRSATTQSMAGVASAIAAAATGLYGANLVTDFLGSVALTGYGRTRELEADRLGARYLASIGYSPRAMIDVVSVLKHHEDFQTEVATKDGREAPSYHALFSSHPEKDKRLQEIIAEAEELVDGAAKPDNRFTYLHYTDGLTYGKKSTIGLDDTGESMHAGLNLAVRGPSEWESRLSKQALMMYSPDNDAVIQVTKQIADIRVHPKEMLRDYLGPDIKLTREEERSVGGRPGFTAVALRAPSPFGARAVRFGIVYIGRDAVILAGAVQPVSEPYRHDDDFLRAFDSIRRMTGSERRASAHATIRVMKADEGTTIEQLVAASRNRRHVEAEVRLINGMYPEGEPEPGQYVKILE